MSNRSIKAVNNNSKQYMNKDTKRNRYTKSNSNNNNNNNNNTFTIINNYTKYETNNTNNVSTSNTTVNTTINIRNHSVTKNDTIFNIISDTITTQFQETSTSNIKLPSMITPNDIKMKEQTQKEQQSSQIQTKDKMQIDDDNDNIIDNYEFSDDMVSVNSEVFCPIEQLDFDTCISIIEDNTEANINDSYLQSSLELNKDSNHIIESGVDSKPYMNKDTTKNRYYTKSNSNNNVNNNSLTNTITNNTNNCEFTNTTSNSNNNKFKDNDDVEMTDKNENDHNNSNDNIKSTINNNNTTTQLGRISKLEIHEKFPSYNNELLPITEQRSETSLNDTNAWNDFKLKEYHWPNCRQQQQQQTPKSYLIEQQKNNSVTMDTDINMPDIASPTEFSSDINYSQFLVPTHLKNSNKSLGSLISFNNRNCSNNTINHKNRINHNNNNNINHNNNNNDDSNRTKSDRYWRTKNDAENMSINSWCGESLSNSECGESTNDYDGGSNIDGIVSPNNLYNDYEQNFDVLERMFTKDDVQMTDNNSNDNIKDTINNNTTNQLQKELISQKSEQKLNKMNISKDQQNKLIKNIKKLENENITELIEKIHKEYPLALIDDLEKAQINVFKILPKHLESLNNFCEDIFYCKKNFKKVIDELDRNLEDYVKKDHKNYKIYKNHKNYKSTFLTDTINNSNVEQLTARIKDEFIDKATNIIQFKICFNKSKKEEHLEEHFEEDSKKRPVTNPYFLGVTNNKVKNLNEDPWNSYNKSEEQKDHYKDNTYGLFNAGQTYFKNEVTKSKQWVVDFGKDINDCDVEKVYVRFIADFTPKKKFKLIVCYRHNVLDDWKYVHKKTYIKNKYCFLIKKDNLKWYPLVSLYGDGDSCCISFPQIHIMTWE